MNSNESNMPTPCGQSSNAMQPLNLPPASLSIRDHMVLDIVRRRYVALTPEEYVRQHVIHALHYQLGYPLEILQVEGAITLNGMTKRCDIVVYDREVKPLMIVECKRPDVPINQKVLDQANRYNRLLRVPYIYLTNGLQHILLRDGRPIPQLPPWQEL